MEPMRQTSSKIAYFEGLRGIAALVVVFHHFALAFYPAIVLGYQAKSHLSIELIIYQTPLNLFFSGRFAVSLFFVMSGYVLSQSYFSSGKAIKVIQSLAVRRYFRLVLPVAGSIVLAYILMRLGAFYNIRLIPYTFSTIWSSLQWNFRPDFFPMLYQAFVGVFIENPSSYISYNTSLWTMYYEFLGSFLVFSFLALFGRFTKRFYIYAILLFFFWTTLFAAFILGMLLSDIMSHKKQLFVKFIGRYAHYLFISGLLLGTYPLFEAAKTGYRFLTIPFLTPDQHVIVYHTFGAFLVVASIPFIKTIRTALSHHWLQFLGSISFSLYVIHIILMCSLTMGIFYYLKPFLGYNQTFMLVFLPSIILFVYCAYWYTKYIDKKSIALAAWVWNKFSQ